LSHDELLRRDVRLLGDTLGSVIREIAGPEAFELVEEVRRLARDRRDGSPHAGLYLAFDERQASAILAGFIPERGMYCGLHGLYREAIVFCASRGLSLDFDGGMDAGVGQVFRAFGASMVPFFQVWKGSNRLVEAAYALR
jgi:hypothetical protein